MTQSVSAKRAYHPFIFIAYYLNFLPQEIRQNIPYTTLYDWKHKNLKQLYGTQYFDDNKMLFHTLQVVAQHKKLQNTIQVLIKIIALKRFITTYQQCLLQNTYNIQKIVIGNIRKINRHLPLETIFKLLHIDAKTYYRWRSNTACKLSAINACIIKHPAQLLHKEVAKIKQYTSDNRYIHWSLASTYHQIRREGYANYCISTFYRYCKALNILRQLPPAQAKK